MSLDIQPGDIVKVSYTVRVQEVYESFLYGHDVQSDEALALGHTTGTARVEMVKRAPRKNRGPKPKAGTVLKGRDVKRVWWKRGTIFKLHGKADVSALVLMEDGRLFPLNNLGHFDMGALVFDDLEDNASFELLHVA